MVVNYQISTLPNSGQGKEKHQCLYQEQNSSTEPITAQFNDCTTLLPCSNLQT
jgi:hypothetical protein